MNLLFEAALEFENYMKTRGEFCFIGGLAVIRWGEIRMTQDIDISLLTDFGNEEKYIDVLLNRYKPRINDIEKFALTNRVMLLFATNKVPIDVAFAALPFEKQMISNATYFEYAPNCSLLTCSAEDLVVLKAFADRPKDWVDVEGIIIRQNKKLDYHYIKSQLKPLCELKEEPEILIKLDQFIKKYSN